MPLLELRTDLKSLKFGGDRKGGGSSGQPYIVSAIPEGEAMYDNPFLYGTGGPDFILRGGSLTPNLILQDEKRLFKYFTDTKNIRGLLFTTNQNILSRLAVKTEATFGPSYGGGSVNEGIYLSINTLAQIPAYLAGLHLNKQGLDPTEYSPLSLNKYFKVVYNNDREGKNRLIGLAKTKINVPSIDPILLSYGGGPGSVLGIGKTDIKFADQRTGINNILYTTDKGFFLKGGLINSSTNRSDLKFNGNKLLGASDSAFVDFDLEKPVDNGFNFPDGQQTRLYGPQDNNSTLTLDSKTLDLNSYQAIQKSYRTIDAPTPSIKNDQGNTKNYLLHPWGVEDFVEGGDIISFFITVIDNDNPGVDNKILYFPAFIDTFNDNFEASWKSEKMAGRGEEFFNYDGFSRNMAFSFKVYAKNRKTLNRMYDNLNYLSSCLAPDYSPSGFMRGNIFKLTLGKYVEDLPGVISSLGFNIPVESSWDIDENVQLPTYIDVSFSFKPIHNFLASRGNKFIARNLPPSDSNSQAQTPDITFGELSEPTLAE